MHAHAVTCKYDWEKCGQEEVTLQEMFTTVVQTVKSGQTLKGDFSSLFELLWNVT